MESDMENEDIEIHRRLTSLWRIRAELRIDSNGLPIKHQGILDQRFGELGTQVTAFKAIQNTGERERLKKDVIPLSEAKILAALFRAYHDKRIRSLEPFQL